MITVYFNVFYCTSEYCVLMYFWLLCTIVYFWLLCTFWMYFWLLPTNVLLILYWCTLNYINLWEWNTNLFGEKKTVQNIHLIHLALNIRTPSRLNLSLAAVGSKIWFSNPYFVAKKFRWPLIFKPWIMLDLIV